MIGKRRRTAVIEAAPAACGAVALKGCHTLQRQAALVDDGTAISGLVLDERDLSQLHLAGQLRAPVAYGDGPAGIIGRVAGKNSPIVDGQLTGLHLDSTAVAPKIKDGLVVLEHGVFADVDVFHLARAVEVIRIAGVALIVVDDVKRTAAPGLIAFKNDAIPDGGKGFRIQPPARAARVVLEGHVVAYGDDPLCRADSTARGIGYGLVVFEGHAVPDAQYGFAFPVPHVEIDGRREGNGLIILVVLIGFEAVEGDVDDGNGPCGHIREPEGRVRAAERMAAAVDAQFAFYGCGALQPRFQNDVVPKDDFVEPILPHGLLKHGEIHDGIEGRRVQFAGEGDFLLRRLARLLTGGNAQRGGSGTGILKVVFGVVERNQAGVEIHVRVHVGLDAAHILVTAFGVQGRLENLPRSRHQRAAGDGQLAIIPRKGKRGQIQRAARHGNGVFDLPVAADAHGPRLHADRPQKLVHHGVDPEFPRARFLHGARRHNPQGIHMRVIARIEGIAYLQLRAFGNVEGGVGSRQIQKAAGRPCGVAGYERRGRGFRHPEKKAAVLHEERTASLHSRIIDERGIGDGQVALERGESASQISLIALQPAFFQRHVSL